MDDLTALPDGARLRVTNLRSGNTRESELVTSGRFEFTLADLSQQSVVEEHDLLRFEFLSPTHTALGRPMIRRIERRHLEQAFLLTTLSAKPDHMELLPNYPNPFNPETWIPFTLDESSTVAVTIFDASGRTVRRMELGHRNAGYHTSRDDAVYWDGRGEDGERVASGVYFAGSTRIPAPPHAGWHS